MNMLKIEETSVAVTTPVGTSASGVVGLMLHHRHHQQHHQNHHHHHTLHLHSQIGHHHPQHNHLHHHHHHHLQQRGVLGDQRTDGVIDTDDGSNDARIRAGGLTGHIQHRHLQANHHHQHNRNVDHLHFGERDPDATVDHDDGDDVLPEVNFNAADEFNLKFFDNTADENCFSGDDEEEEGPASVDSTGDGRSLADSPTAGLHLHVQHIQQHQTSLPQHPHSQIHESIAVTSVSAPPTSDVLQMSTSPDDDLGEWMDDFVQNTASTFATARPDHTMVVKDEMYDVFNHNNCADRINSKNSNSSNNNIGECVNRIHERDGGRLLTGICGEIMCFLSEIPASFFYCNPLSDQPNTTMLKCIPFFYLSIKQNSQIPKHLR